MTTNQEGRHAAIRESTSTAYGVAADWHALFDDAGIGAGTFNERLLAWINAELSASHSNLVSAMQAYAEDAGYDGWEDMATLVLAMNGAETLLDGETQGLAFDFTDQSALIIDTGTPANNYDSSGIVSSGSLVGPSGKLVYTNPSNKLCRQADGYYRYQAHNLCLHSENLTTTWTNLNTTDSLSGETPPSPYTTAYTLTDNGTNGRHIIYQQFTLVSGAPYTASVVLNAGTATHAAVTLDGGGANGYSVNVDLSDGTVTDTNTSGTVKNPSNSVIDLGGGWYRVNVSIGAVNGGGACYLTVAVSNSATPTWSVGSPSYVGTGSTIHVTGCVLRRTPSNSDYIKTTSAAVYSLPYSYASDGSCEGILCEEARTNLCLYSNDLTNAAWTKSNMTTAKTATGPDNVANSATTITASAGNATVLQAITSTSAARVTSVYIKRRTGTGNIDLTQDNGATWTTQAVDSTWTRFSLSSVTSANPTVGIRIVTSGDAVDVALFSHEVGAFPTSPILTYGAAATRNADPLSQLATTFPLSATAGSFYAYVTPYAGADLAGIVSLNDGSGDEEIVIYKDASANIVAQVEDGGVNQLAPLDSTVNASSNTAFKVALAWAANDFALSADGTAAQTDTGGTLPTVTTLEIGVDQANNYFNGIIKAISYVPRRKTNAELQAETA